MQLKRQHSFDPPTQHAHEASQSPTKTPTAETFGSALPPSSSSGTTPALGGSGSTGGPPDLLPSASFDPKDPLSTQAKSSAASGSTAPVDAAIIGSPLKKQRASVSRTSMGANTLDVGAARSSADAVAKGLGFGFVEDEVPRDK